MFLRTAPHSALLVAALAFTVIACGDDDSGGAAGAGAASSGGQSSGGTGGSMTGGGAAGSGGSAGQAGAGGAGATGPAPTLPPPDLGTWTGDAPIALTPSVSLPGDLVSPGATHYGALPCGPFTENLFDLVVPAGNGPFPTLVYIHGGGFTGGSRLGSFTGGSAATTADYLNAGFAYATIDYRFRDALGEGVRTSLQDSQVCIQYLRLHAATLGLDANRMVFAEGSAGAGTSLWLGTADDMADATSGHPVLAMSTRPQGVVILATQATYDIVDWLDVVFNPEYTGLLSAGVNGGLFDSELASFYGIALEQTPSMVDFLRNDPGMQDYRGAIDMLELMSPDDPPIFARTDGAEEAPTDVGIIYHHPFHVRAVINAAEAANVEVVADVQALGLDPVEDQVAFATRVVQ